jgi:hypothetical protein
MAKAHYHLQRKPEKLRNKAKFSNEVGLIVNAVGVGIAIVFLPGVGSLPFAWPRSADPIVHKEKIRTMPGSRLEVHRLSTWPTKLTIAAFSPHD